MGGRGPVHGRHEGADSFGLVLVFSIRVGRFVSAWSCYFGCRPKLHILHGLAILYCSFKCSHPDTPSKIESHFLCHFVSGAGIECGELPLNGSQNTTSNSLIICLVTEEVCLAASILGGRRRPGQTRVLGIFVWRSHPLGRTSVFEQEGWIGSKGSDRQRGQTGVLTICLHTLKPFGRDDFFIKPDSDFAPTPFRPQAPK
jgi:hypothetical protein